MIKAEVNEGNVKFEVKGTGFVVMAEVTTLVRCVLDSMLEKDRPDDMTDEKVVETALSIIDDFTGALKATYKQEENKDELQS